LYFFYFFFISFSPFILFFYENARDLAIPGASYLGDLADQPALRPPVGLAFLSSACADNVPVILCQRAVSSLRRIPYPPATLTL